MFRRTVENESLHQGSNNNYVTRVKFSTSYDPVFYYYYVPAPKLA
jgi:hypothetical protein